MQRILGAAAVTIMGVISATAQTAPPNVADVIRLDLRDVVLQRAGFGVGNVAVMKSVTVVNRYAVDRKDITLRCEQHGSSGTVIGRVDRVIYATVPHGKSVTVRNLNLGFVDPQTVRMPCDIVSAAY